MIPEAIRRELADRLQPTPRADREIGPGDLRRCRNVDGEREERLVMVLKVDTARETAQVTLVHSFPEYATPDDIIVDGAVTALNYSIVVQGDLRGVVWLRELDRLVSRVPAEVVSACFSPQLPSFDQVGLAGGPRLGGRLDARWDFKVAEWESMARLCADCTSSLLDGESIGLDFDGIFSAMLAPSPNAQEMVDALHNLLIAERDRLHFTLDHVAFLCEKGLLDDDKWEAIPGGLELRHGHIATMIDRARSQFLMELHEPDVILGIPELIAR